MWVCLLKWHAPQAWALRGDGRGGDWDTWPLGGGAWQPPPAPSHLAQAPRCAQPIQSEGPQQDPEFFREGHLRVSATSNTKEELTFKNLFQANRGLGGYMGTSQALCSQHFTRVFTLKGED